MPYINETDYQCSCGNIFQLPKDATRCPCDCHGPALEQAKEQETYCQVCGYATLDKGMFRQHFNWRTHLAALQAQGGAGGDAS